MRTDIYINRILIFFWVSVCVALAYVDLTFISQNIGADSETLMELRDYIPDETGDSYRYTALFFASIPVPLLIPFVLLVSAISLFVFMKNLRKLSSIVIAMYLTLPGFIMFMTRPLKDTIILIMNLIILFFIQKISKLPLKFFVIASTYILYALFFRKYYFITTGIFTLFILSSSVMYSLKISKSVYCLFSILLVCLIILFLPESFFMETQGTRDMINSLYTREARTAFLNPLPTTNGVYFIINYLYSILRLNLPIFFTLSYKELFHMASIFIFGYLLMLGFRQDKNSDAKICAQLSLSHILVLMIFEPDLGSYLRHLTSIFIYFTPMLLLYDKSKVESKD